MSSEAPSSGGPSSQPEILLAKWSDRFFAWLIDFVIVNVVVNAVFAAAAFPFWFGRAMWWDGDFFGGPLHYLITSTAFFSYWAFFETAKSQSIGKMVLKLRTVDLAGRPADARSVAIQGFGKAFLLPIDVILGWLFTNEKRQRIFNRASDTIVVKAHDNRDVPGVTYRKD